MANLKSQKKRNITNEKARQRNVAIRTRVRTYLKKAETAIEAKDAGQIDTTVSEAIVEIDVAARKGVYHQNNAARKKSRLIRRAAKAKS